MNPLSKLNFPTLSQMAMDDHAQPVIDALDGFFADNQTATLAEVNTSLNDYSQNRAGDNHNDAQFFSLHILLTYLFKRLAESVNISTVLNTDNIQKQSLKVLSKLNANQLQISGTAFKLASARETVSVAVIGTDRFVNRGVIAQATYEGLTEDVKADCAGMLLLPTGADNVPNIVDLGFDNFMREYVCPVTNKTTESAVARWNATYNAVLNHLLSTGAYDQLFGGAIDETPVSVDVDRTGEIHGTNETTFTSTEEEVVSAISGGFDTETTDYDSVYVY